MSASVRFRTTTAAIVVVAVALVIGAGALLAAMRSALLTDLRTVSEVRAAEIAASLEAGERPALAVPEPEEQLVQVVDGDGGVVAASSDAEGLPAVADLAPGDSARVRTPLSDDELLVVAVAARAVPATAIGGRGGDLTVLVGRSVEDALESTQLVAGLLAAGAPVLLLVVAVTTWALVGRALAPVEAIRAEVERISTAELGRRVPQPSGRDEIARLAETMNVMLARLQEGQARQRRFVADASHELRSPVASLRQHAEVERSYPGRSGLPELTETVLAETDRMQHLLDDLLLLARADEGALPLRRRPVDLDDLVLEEARALRQSEPDLVVDTARVSAGQVRGDAASLARVLRNLGSNAARHAAHRIAFTLTETGGEVVLTVDDDGPGIAPADRRRVLDRFVRLDAGRSRDAGGAGLGLAIVDELVAAHGGRIAIGESPLGGARFEIRLPASFSLASATPPHTGDVGARRGEPRRHS